MALGAVALDLPQRAGHDERQHLVLDPAPAALRELALGLAAHLLGDPRGDHLEVDQGQMVFRHPAHGPDGAEKRDLAAPAQIPEEQPARVARDQGPVDVEEGPDARHGRLKSVSHNARVNRTHRDFPSAAVDLARRGNPLARRVGAD